MTKVWPGTYIVQKAELKYGWIFNSFKMLKKDTNGWFTLLKMLK